MQVEALVRADAPVKPGASFPVSGRAAEPMRTPLKRALTVRGWPALSATWPDAANLQATSH